MSLVSIPDVRAEGLTTAEASDARLATTLSLVDEYVRLITRQTFESLTFADAAPLLVDGTGIETLDLPIPILELLSIVEDWDVSGLGTTIDLADVQTFTERKPRDDRRYPRIAKIPSARGMYVAAYYGRQSPAYWTRGYRNVALTGSFGYLDGNWKGTWSGTTAYAIGDAVTYQGQDYLALAASTGVTPAAGVAQWQFGAAPAPIRRVAILIALREYRLLTDPYYAVYAQKARAQSETTDGHSYTLTGLIASGGFTGDPIIDDVLTLYTRRGGGTTGSIW